MGTTSPLDVSTEVDLSRRPVRSAAHLALEIPFFAAAVVRTAERGEVAAHRALNVPELAAGFVDWNGGRARVRRVLIRETLELLGDLRQRGIRRTREALFASARGTPERSRAPRSALEHEKLRIEGAIQELRPLARTGSRAKCRKIRLKRRTAGCAAARMSGTGTRVVRTNRLAGATRAGARTQRATRRTRLRQTDLGSRRPIQAMLQRTLEKAPIVARRLRAHQVELLECPSDFALVEPSRRRRGFTGRRRIGARLSSSTSRESPSDSDRQRAREHRNESTPGNDQQC
jgi:hypothetical protein